MCPPVNYATPSFSTKECVGTYQVPKETETLMVNKFYHEFIETSDKCHIEISEISDQPKYRRIVWHDAERNIRSARNKVRRL